MSRELTAEEQAALEATDLLLAGDQSLSWAESYFRAGIAQGEKQQRAAVVKRLREIANKDTSPRAIHRAVDLIEAETNNG